MNRRRVSVRRLSSGDANHFFGYYDVNPYDPTLRYHLALETAFQNRRPSLGDTARVGLVDAESGQFLPQDETRAFNFQQGAMLNWVNTSRGWAYCFNDLMEGRLRTVLSRPFSGEKLVLDGAVSGVSPARPLAASLNYLRNFQCRPVVGYDAGQKGAPEDRCPENDGLFTLDLETGKRRLIVSMTRLLDALPAKEAGEGWMWFDHTSFNPSGTRILFFVRVRREDGKGWYTSLWTVSPDGSDLRNQLDYTRWISHYDWLDDETILISTEFSGKRGFFTFHDGKADFAPFFPDVMPEDGHACFSPNREWLVCDTYPDAAASACSLFLFHPKSGERIDIGAFYAPPPYRGDIRCDLHPRFSANGARLTFDSVHEANRQIYEVNTVFCV